MRINFLLPSKDISGGVKSTFELANRLQARGNVVRVIYPLFPESNGESWLDLGHLRRKALGTLMNLKKGNRVEWFELDVELMRLPWMSARRIPPGDILVATWWMDTYTAVRCAPDRGLGFHVIRSYEEWGGPRDQVDNAYRLPLRKISISTWLRDYISDKFKVAVEGPILNGIDVGLFFVERNDLEGSSPRRIGLMYRRAPVKGMEEGLEALLRVEKEYRDSVFVIFGEPPTPEDRQAINRLGKVEYHKLPFGERLRGIYNSLDVFLMPSRMEGFANPPMEAMACGAACVITNVGGVSDYVLPGKTAIVVEPCKPDEMAEAVLALMRDERRRQAIAIAGLEHIRKFTWEKSALRLEGLFAEALSPAFCTPGQKEQTP